MFYSEDIAADYSDVTQRDPWWEHCEVYTTRLLLGKLQNDYAINIFLSKLHAKLIPYIKITHNKSFHVHKFLMTSHCNSGVNRKLQISLDFYSVLTSYLL